MQSGKAYFKAVYKAQDVHLEEGYPYLGLPTYFDCPDPACAVENHKAGGKWAREMAKEARVRTRLAKELKSTGRALLAGRDRE